MAGGVELGTAYVSLVIDSKQVPGQVKSALSGVSAQGDVAGQGLGARMASGIGSAFKVGGAAIGAAAALTIGTALTKGMERVVAIDDAKGKLAGLGHSTEGVANIMDSALKSVKGTAYGLGDAAGIAASAVAAGIKPGEELTKYLSLTGDAATIAGSSLGEMGSIFNKVQTSGKAYTDTLNQLSDRGIPIFQWLQDEYGVSSEELSKMVKSGKVDAETFNKVIQENIGGAALESGKTLRGSFANMKAALGRAGASVIEPFLPMMKAGLGKITEFADKVTPGLKTGAEKVASGLTDMGRAFQSSGESVEGPANAMERFGIRARKVADGIQGVWSVLTKGEFTGADKMFGLEEDSKAVDILFKIRETAIGVKDILFKGDYTNPIWGQLEDSKAVDILFRIREGAVALWEAIKSPSGEKFSAFLDTVKGSGDGAASAMGKVESGASTLTGVLKSIGAAAVGGGIALAALGGDTATVAVAGIKALGGVMGFFADHTGLATVALAGLAASFAIAQTAQTAFHIARVAQVIMTPAEIASRMAMTAAIVAQTAVMRAHIVALGGEAPVQQLSMRQRVLATFARQRETAATIAATSSLAAYAAAQRAAAAQSGLMVGTLRQTAAGVATLGSKIQGVGGAALSSMRSGFQRVGAMLGPGGLFTIGVMAAAAAGTAFVSTNNGIVRSLEESRGAADRSAQTFREYRKSLDEAFSSSGGNIDTGVKSVVKDQIASIEKDLSDAEGRIPSKWEKLVGLGSDVFQTSGMTSGLADIASFAGFNFSSTSDVSELQKVGEAAKATGAAFKDFGITSADIAKGISGSDADWAQLQFRMNAAGGEGSELTQKYGQMRAELVSSRTSASAVSDAFKAMHDGAVGAAAGVDGLTNSMATWRGDLMTAEEAQSKVTLALSGFNTAAANAGSAARTASGELDMTTTAGAGLHREMQSVATAFDAAGAAAAQSAVDQKLSAADTAAAVQAAGQKVRDEFIRQRMEAGDTLAQATALANQYKLWPEVLPTHVQLTGTAEAQAAINNFIAANQDRKILVDIVQNVIAPPSGPSMPTTLGGMYGVPGGFTGMRLPKNSKGSRMPTTGPGTDRTDGILGIGSNGVPTSWVDKGEWIINGRSSEKYNGLLAAINRDDPRLKNLPAYAEGGRNGITNALSAGKSVDGNTYLWGGTGPTNFDCSGFVGWLHQIVMGVTGSIKRLYTTYNLMGSSGVGGLQPGLGPAGTQFQVGVSQEHMAATIAGHSAESGGAHGTSGIDGGRANAQSSQFPKKWYLPNALIANWIEGQSSTAVPNGVSGASTSRKVEWTEKNQLDLESAEISITQAEEARAEVEAKFREGKKSQADLDQANKRVEKAQQRVTDLQKKKDDAAAGVDEVKGPAPQAPGMAKAFSDSEVERLEAQMAVNDANKRRNEVYDDEEASADDRLRADIALQKAEAELDALAKGKKDGDKDYSLNGIMKRFAHSAVDAGFSALEGQDYFGLMQSRWFTTDWKALAGEPASPESGTVSQAEVDAQTGGMPWYEALIKNGDYTPEVYAATGLEEDSPLVDLVLRARAMKAPKVFDNGGWLLPGESAINLSTKPEPIFNSPAQLGKFMGGDGLKPAQPAVNDYSIHIGGDMVASNTDELVKNLRFEQKRMVYGLTGG